MQQTPTTVTPLELDERPKRRRRGILALLLGLTTISLGAGMFSLAIFTDSDTSTGSFATGTIDLNSNPSLAFTVTGMVPGDVESALLTISNDGTVDLRYAMSATATGVLGDTLELSVLAEDTDGGCDDRDGAVIEPAAALDGAGYGDPAQGDDTGDRVLVAGADEDLCFVVELPDTTGNGAQGLTTDATFLFEGEQTDNNP
jgi:hypothetical protein